MSLSADSINLGFAFLYIGYIFSLAYGENKNIKPFVAMTILSVLFKGVFLLSLLFLLVPKEKIKYKNILFAVTFLVGACLQSLLSSHSYILVGDNIDVEARKMLIFTRPFYVIKLFINTFIHKASFYLHSSIFRLGWLDIQPNPIPVLLLYGCYLVSSTLDSIKQISCKDKMFILLINMTFILLTTLLYYLTFSPLAKGLIIGTQGRYFIPLHLTFAAVIQNHFKADKITVKVIILSVIVFNLIYAGYLIFRT